jgi:hypothetical protein
VSAVPLKAWIWLALVLLPVAACGGGGTLSTKAFQKQAESLQSLAAEGALVADGTAEGRTTETFVSVHTEYLREIVNLMTLAAEVGGVALVLQLLSGLPYRVLILVGIIGLAVVIWIAPLDWIERIFGYGGSPCSSSLSAPSSSIRTGAASLMDSCLT